MRGRQNVVRSRTSFWCVAASVAHQGRPWRDERGDPALRRDRRQARRSLRLSRPARHSGRRRRGVEPGIRPGLGRQRGASGDAGELWGGPTGAQWIVNAYLLPLGALVLVGGALGDRYGRRRVFLVGLAVFIAACILCAVAPTFPILLLGRALEGLSAALIAPTSLAIIADGFSGKERGRAVGTWAAAGAAAGALAPLLGGLLVDGPGWRWIFVAVVPLGLYAFVVARARCGRAGPSAASARRSIGSAQGSRRRAFSP